MSSIDEPVIYSDDRVPYPADGIGYTGDTYPNNGANGVSVSSGSVSGSPAFRAGAGSGDEFGTIGLSAAISNSSTITGVIVPEPNLNGSVDSPGIPAPVGSVDGTLGHDGAVSGTTDIPDVTVTGVIGPRGSVIAFSGVAFSVSGTSDYRSTVSGDGAASGTVVGVISVTSDGVSGIAIVNSDVSGSLSVSGGSSGTAFGIGLTSGEPGYFGIVSDVSVINGDQSGAINVAGAVSGVSVSSGSVIREQLTKPKPKPSGYVWSFSGDAIPIRNPTGMVSALSAAIGTASGSQGFTSGITGTVDVLGQFTGRTRIREEDDMEILQLLELV